MADEIVIGKIGLTPKGEYVPGELYDILDMVSHEGNSYVSKIQNNEADVTNTEAWLLAAEKGEDGLSIKGDKGDTFTFNDLTTEQKEELKGDVIAYNSLDEADKDDLASRVPILGVIEEGNTNAVSGGEVFEKTIKPNDIDKKVIVSPNLFNPLNVILDRFISITVDMGIQTGAGWRTIWASVGYDADFAISGWDSVRREIGFFNGSATNANRIKTGPANLLGFTKVGDTLFGKTPANANIVAVTAKNATEAVSVYSKFQIELGTEVTPYQPYGSENFIEGIKNEKIAVENLLINGKIVDTSMLVLKEEPQTENEFTFDNTIAAQYSTMTFNYKGKTIYQRFRSKRGLDIRNPNTFDWNTMQIDGVTKHSQPDENAPYRITGWTVGGNHGYRAFQITAVGHGKTSIDIGSVWTDGSNQWVLIGVVNTGTLMVSHRTENITVLTANILTHVSGGTNTTDINSTTKISQDFYPPSKNYSLKIFVDDVLVDQNDIYIGKERLTFIESYDILLKSSIMDWFVANVGSITVPTQPDGTSIARVTNTYAFDTKMMCYTQQSFQALNDVELPFQDIMFLMANKLTVPNAVYVPKSLPFIQNSIYYDFRTPLSYAVPTISRINFDSLKYEKWGRIPDRVMHIATGENLGFTIGFLPVQDGSTDIRKVLASRKSIQFNESGKIYMSGVDSDDITTMKKGDVYQIQGYKGYFFKEGDRTANYVVDTPQGKYYYYDWHQEAVESIYLNNSQIIEKSPNVALIGNKVSVSINSDTPYAYLIFKK